MTDWVTVYSDFRSTSVTNAPRWPTDHRITLPVPKAPLAVDNSRALINRDLVGDAATPVIGAIALAPELLTTQEPVQIAA